ncbi:MAG: hypothetical protein U0414_00855 [Polyangiaceae bacterium]
MIGRSSQRLVGASLLAACGALAPAARGDEACAVRVTPVDAPPAWQAAKSDAEHRLATWPAAHDCRQIELLVHPDGGATLTFLTSDGRGTARALEQPSEVVPALEALLVTLPAPVPEPGPPPAPPPTPPVPAPPLLAPRTQAPAPVVDPPRSSAPAVHVVVDLEVGARFSFGETQYASPTVAVRPGVSFGPWELDLRLDLTPLFAPLDRAALEGFAMSSVTAGIGFGRREVLPSAAFGYGLWVGVAAVSQEATASPAQTTPRELEAVQPHIGAAGRVVLPSRGWGRALFELNLDLALARLRPGAVRERALLDLPRFGAVVAVGAEFGVL